jgi:hypothetical protein
MTSLDDGDSLLPAEQSEATLMRTTERSHILQLFDNRKQLEDGGVNDDWAGLEQGLKVT